MQYLIYLTIFALPLHLVRLKFGWVPFSALEILIYLTVVVFFVVNKKIYRNTRARQQIKRFSLMVFFITLLLMGLLSSSLISGNLQTSLGIMKGWFFAPLLFGGVVYFFAQTMDHGNRSQFFKILLFSFTVSGLIVSIIALGYYLAGNTTFDGRLSAFYQSPNQLAMFLTGPFLVSLHMAVEYSVVKLRILWIIVGVIIGGTILLTQSAGAFMGIITALTFACLMRRSFSYRAPGIVYAVIIFVSLVLPFSSLVPGMRDLAINAFGERSSLAARMEIWESAIAIGAENPILGIGPGMFQEHYLAAQQKFTPYLEWAVPHPHNLFLTFWLYTGITGLFGFVGILLVSFWRTCKSAHGSHQSLPILTILIAMIVHGAIDTTYWSSELALIFWLLIATLFIEFDNSHNQ